MEPLVSIIVPMYNVEKFIDKCVVSLINQTYKNLEIILVNDGSPDNCGNIAEQYAKLDNRIRVYHKPNGGLSDARNKGLEVCEGEYVCFIDSDDYVEVNLIENVLNKALNAKADVVIFGLYNETLDENDNIIIKDPVMFNPEEPRTMLSVVGYAWNKLYKTSYLNKNKFSFQKGLSLVEDIVFNDKALTQTKNIEYVNTPLYHYVSRSRPTLVKQYHKDSFELHKLGFKSRKNVIFSLFGINRKTQELLAKSHINGIRYCCSNMFNYKNDLDFKAKYNNIKAMLNDELTLEHANYFQPENISDKLVKFVILSKLPTLLFIMYKLRSLRKKKVGDFN